MEGKCEGCYNFKILQFPCECKKVSYCSEDCKRKDEQYHMQRCEKTDSDEETMDKLARTETSVDGRCGLRNLGNTCFMNSGL
jgi:ubiquitin carboxyl-terminal hydrolase 4/11/15